MAQTEIKDQQELLKTIRHAGSDIDGEIAKLVDVSRGIETTLEGIETSINDNIIAARKSDATLEAIADHLGEIHGTLQRIARALENQGPV